MLTIGFGIAMLAKIADARVPMIPVSSTPSKSNRPSEDCKKIAKVYFRRLLWSRSASDFFCNLQNSTLLPYLNDFV